MQHLPSSPCSSVLAKLFLAHICWRQKSAWLVIGSFQLWRHHPATDSIHPALQGDKEQRNLMLLLENWLLD